MPLADGGYFSALGGLYSSVRDLARWSGVFLDAEPPRDAPERAPVSRATLREMSRARSAFAPGVEWPSLAEPPGVIAGGYGYGLMIWHERDGQRHVGHPGGLPGFGTLMRWVPELGLSVILLANVTYAKCERPVRRALELVAREAALPRRAIRRDPGLLAARDAVDGLVRAAGTTPRRRGCSRPTSTSTARWPSGARSWRRWPSVTARSCRDGDIDAEDALRGSWRLRGERGHVELAITMAPTVPPLVQTLSVESVLPPSGRLGELAADGRRDWRASPTRRRSQDLLAPGSRRRRGPARAARGGGALRPVRRPRAGRRRRRGNDDAAPPEPARKRRLELELELEPSDRLAKLIAAPALPLR